MNNVKRVCIKKNYKVVLECMNIKLICNDIDWFNKQIIVNHQIENIIVNIQRLTAQNNNNTQLILPLLTINKYALLYDDILKYWNTIKDMVKLVKNLKINSDYFIAPCYIENDLLVLGIVLFSNKNADAVLSLSQSTSVHNYYLGRTKYGDLSRHNAIDYKVVESYNYLSTLPTNTTTNTANINIQIIDVHMNNLHLESNMIDDFTENKNSKVNKSSKVNKFNIIDGILNYKIINNGIITTLGKNILNDKHINIYITEQLNFNIKWEYVLRNISNYLPKFDIVYKPKLTTMRK